MSKFLALSAALCLLSGVARGNDFAPALPMPSILLANDQLVTRIAFGSCSVPSMDTRIFDVIRKTNADLFLLIGDNVYSESEQDDPQLTSLKSAYGKFAESEAFSSLRESMPLLVTWDDHDYGLDDAGGDWPHKQASQALYNHVWAVDETDERATRDGVYCSLLAGPIGRRV